MANKKKIVRKTPAKSAYENARDTRHKGEKSFSKDYEDRELLKHEALGDEMDPVVRDEAIDLLSDLSTYKQDYVMHYSFYDDKAEAVRAARLKHRLPMIKSQVNIDREIFFIELDSDVVKAIDKIRKNKSKLLTNRVMQLGQKAVEKYAEVVDETSEIKSIDEEINSITMREEELKEEIRDASLSILSADPESKAFKELVTMRKSLYRERRYCSVEKRNWIKTKLDVKRAIERNLKTVHEITNSSKEKTVIKAGAINIQVGNYSKPDRKSIDDVIENESDEVIHEL